MASVAATTTSPSPASTKQSATPPRSPIFTPIMENKKEEEGDEETEPKEKTSSVAMALMAYQHQPTPLHPSSTTTTTPTPTNNSTSSSVSTSSTTPAKAKKQTRISSKVEDFTVSCNKCRPSARDKTSSTSVVPLDSSGINTSPGPNGMIRALFHSLTRRSPRSSASSSSSKAPASAREEEWRMAAAELSRKLIHATRKRDEAVAESTRLKTSLAELEKKLDRLECYCHDLKSALDRCSSSVNTTTHQSQPQPRLPGIVGLLQVDPFLRSVSEARSGVRHLSRALAAQMRHGAGPKCMDRLAALLQPFGVPAAQCRNARSLLFYLEALLNRVFYSDFEAGFGLTGEGIFDPAAQCESNRAAYETVHGVTWEDVLSSGTRHFSEGLSRFCDRRMGEVVSMLAWAKAWPESLLQAFFSAAKGVWLVHLLARSVHPPIPVLRVDSGARFDSGYMEDVASERVPRLSPANVRTMVAPGFYVYAASSGVIKCKVLCMYNSPVSVNNSETDSVVV